MIVIYHCWGGAHSSVTAASIHLGLLPSGRIPAKEEFLHTKHFDRQGPGDHGKIFPLGIDEQGHQICFMGRTFYAEIIIRAIGGVAKLHQLDPNQIIFVDVMSCVNYVMMLGGSVSRALHLIAVGRPIVIRGTQQSYGRLVQLVNEVKKGIREKTGDDDE